MSRLKPRPTRLLACWLHSSTDQEEETRDDQHAFNDRDEYLLGQAVEDALAQKRAEDHDGSEAQANQRARQGQDSGLAIGNQLDDVHHYSREGFGADVRALYKAVCEEERRHDRPDAAEQSGKETRTGSNSCEGRDRKGFWLGAEVTPHHNEQQESAEQASERGQRRLRKQETAEQGKGNGA